MNITDVLQGCRQGDRAAQNELYRTYANKVMNTARRYTKDSSEAKDVVQNTFVKVFTQLDKYDSGKGAFQSWIVRIAVNEALLIKRRDKKYFYPEEPHEVLDKSVDSPIFSSMGIEEIKKIVNALPEGYRMIFNLFVVEGFSHSEIGELLGINEVTSRSQLLRARKAIQKSILKNENILKKKMGKAV